MSGPLQSSGSTVTVNLPTDGIVLSLRTFFAGCFPLDLPQQLVERPVVAFRQSRKHLRTLQNSLLDPIRYPEPADEGRQAGKGIYKRQRRDCIPFYKSWQLRPGL